MIGTFKRLPAGLLVLDLGGAVFGTLKRLLCRTSLLSLLSGCLYVTSSGVHGQTGIQYDCTYRLNNVWHDENICGPADNDPQYVLDRFHPRADPLVKITCTSTPIPCIFYPSELDDPDPDADIE